MQVFKCISENRFGEVFPNNFLLCKLSGKVPQIINADNLYWGNVYGLTLHHLT